MALCRPQAVCAAHSKAATAATNRPQPPNKLASAKAPKSAPSAKRPALTAHHKILNMQAM